MGLTATAVLADGAVLADTAAQADTAAFTLIGNGDATGLGLLYDRYGGLAFALAVRVLGDRLAAEEVVQDVFVNAWRAAAQFDSERGSVRAWLLASVHHRCIDQLRRRAGRGDHAVPLDSVAEVAGTADVAGEVLRRLDATTVRAALATLPAEQRQALLLAYFDGLPATAIARALALPLGTVKGRLRLGLQKLRCALAPLTLT